MLSSIAIRDQFQASLDLLRGRIDAVRRFDISIEGFWASFQIMVLAIVPYFLVVLANQQLDTTQSALTELGGASSSFYIARVIALPVEWVAFPLAMIPLARMLSLQSRYVSYVVVRNWCNLPAVIASGFVALLFLSGIVGQEGFLLLSLVAFAIAIRLKWLALRLALGTDVPVSIALLICDFLLSILVLVLIDKLLGIA